MGIVQNNIGIMIHSAHVGSHSQTDGRSISVLTKSNQPRQVAFRHAFLGEPSTADDSSRLPDNRAISEIIAVHEICAPLAAYSPGKLPHLTLFLTLRGRTQVMAGGQNYWHQPGSIIAIAQGCEIVERVNSESVWDIRYTMLEGAWAQQMNTYLRQGNVPVISIPCATAHCRQIYREMTDCAFAQNPGWEWVFMSRSAEIFGILWGSGAVSPGGSLAANVALWLDSKPQERFSLSQLSAQFERTPRQFIYEMRKATNEPLARWIRKRRIGTARHLLQQGESVTRVAQRLGFANPFHFSRAFKAVTGFSPSQIAASPRAGLHDAPLREQAETAEKIRNAPIP